MDHHVPRAITDGLRARGVDVITAFEDGTSELDDIGLLDRAAELGRVLFTRDYDLLREATERQRTGQSFYGLIYSPSTAHFHWRLHSGLRDYCESRRTRRLDE